MVSCRLVSERATQGKKLMTPHRYEGSFFVKRDFILKRLMSSVYIESLVSFMMT